MTGSGSARFAAQLRPARRAWVHLGVCLLITTMFVVRIDGVARAGARELEVDCPSTTTTTTTASTTTTTLDPLCAILGTDVKKKKRQIASADEVWLGDVHTDGNLGGCLDSWDGIILLVLNDDKITKPSTGLVETTGQPGCTVLGGAAGAAYTETFEIRGRVSGKRVQLKFLDPTDACLGLARDPSVSIACWGVAGGSVTRTGSQITGSFTTDLGQTTFETTIDADKSF
jgi:hypothetical protein